MVTIRPATDADADEIERIFSSSIRDLAKAHYNQVQIESWSGGFGVDRIRERIRAGGTYVAEVDGTVAGFVEINLTTAEIEMVYVDPHCARRGIGSALMTFAEDVARNAGLKTVHLRGSLNAVPFYEAMGYTVTERIIHCNARGVEFDCTIMEKQLA